jgi:N-methylhydantoinase B/oxoprolinase/acetone carboxylase alpha subunit
MFEAEANSVFTISTPGGGGYGDDQSLDKNEDVVQVDDTLDLNNTKLTGGSLNTYKMVQE